jgi:hypothetical protein
MVDPYIFTHLLDVKKLKARHSGIPRPGPTVRESGKEAIFGLGSLQLLHPLQERKCLTSPVRTFVIKSCNALNHFVLILNSRKVPITLQKSRYITGQNRSPIF